MSRIGWLCSAWRRLRAGGPGRRRARPGGLGPSEGQARQADRGASPRRHVHLGVDFGTCWSKLVLRDYQASTDRCFVVRPGVAFGGSSDYRIPSSVTVADGRLYFGWTGEAEASRLGAYVIRSPKMGAAFPATVRDLSLYAGLSAEDVSILVVTYLLQLGFYHARAYCAALSPAATPRMSMSMGVPMSVLDESPLRDRFLTIARGLHLAGGVRWSREIQFIGLYFSGGCGISRGCHGNAPGPNRIRAIPALRNKSERSHDCARS